MAWGLSRLWCQRHQCPGCMQWVHAVATLASKADSVLGGNALYSGCGLLTDLLCISLDDKQHVYHGLNRTHCNAVIMYGHASRA